MNRAVKFRGLSATAGWVYGNLNLYTRGKNKALITSFDGLQSWVVFPDSVGQFTGLYDNGAKEIYEGDILGSLYEIGNPTGEVIFEDGSYCVRDSDGDCLFLNNTFESKPIIGNIVENPDLLTITEGR